jgi:HlyD family secretion protein
MEYSMHEQELLSTKLPQPVAEPMQTVEPPSLPSPLPFPRPPDALASKGSRKPLKKIHYVVAALAITAIAIGGLFGGKMLSAKRADASFDRAASGGTELGDVQSVPVIRPVRTTVRRTTTQPGTVHAYFDAKVYARVSGYLKELKADIGDPVEEGQVLARIDVPELEKKRERLRADIARLEAEHAQAGAEVETARAQVAAYEAQVGQALSEVKKAEASLAADLAEFQRIEKVAKGGNLDQGVLNEAQNRYQASLAGRQVAEAAVAAAKANSALAGAKLQAAQANEKTAATRTEVARKELEELAAQIDFATLRAPFRGVVTTRGIDLGDLVGDMHKSMNAGPLFTVSLIDKLRLRVPIPERDAPLVKEGRPAEFRSEAFPAKVFPGKVSRLASGLDRRTRTMLVEVDLDNRNRELLPGMFGQVTLLLEERPDCLVLPVPALRHDNAGKCYVLAAGPDGKVCRINVITGHDNGQRTEILQGLTGQEQIITAQIAGLAPGQVVRCVEEK